MTDRIAAVGTRVLLVDDVADLRFLLRVVLETDGSFEVVGEAGDGETAVELCVTTRPDVIILDLSMPTMDGLEALPRLREAAPDATIAVLSGFEGARVASSTSQLGADAYFEKGTPPHVVVSALKELLGITTQTPIVDGSTHLSGEELHAVVAHDLRSPLAAIIGFGETLGERWDEIDESVRRSMVQRITAQARALHAMTENLLTARAVDLDVVGVHLEAVAPAVLLTDLAEQVRPLCPDHVLDVHVDPDTPIVLVDRVRLQQVVTNLVSNAVRHAPAGSSIGLCAGADGSWVAIEVVDRGPGVPAGERARVLEKHVRLTRDTSGLGLGLFIASSLAKAMGGSLAIAEREGGGARVVCRVRVAEVDD
jgi:signal transduction histidine kinase